MTETMRLSKAVAQQFNRSRREAELLIEGGWVQVDGEVVEEPYFKVAAQTLSLHPDAKAEAIEPVTILLHKPAGLDFEASDFALEQCLCAETHWPDDEAPAQMLKKHFVHLKALMPLETAACGLVIFSQDQRISRKLIDDAFKVEQEFIVEVTGKIIDKGLQKLNHGLIYDGMTLPPIKVSWQNETRLRFALKTPREGQITHMCASVGLTAQSIKRIRIGRIPMAGMPLGQWRYLPANERF